MGWKAKAWRIVAAMILLTWLMILGGCGQKREKENARENLVPEVISDEWVPLQVLEHSWRGFQEADEATEAWHPEDYRDGFGLSAGKNLGTSDSLYAWSGDMFYVLSRLYEEKGEDYAYNLVVTRIDTVSMEKKDSMDMAGLSPAAKERGVSIDEAQWKELLEAVKQGRAVPVSFDVFGDDIYLFLAWYDEGWDLLHYDVVVMGMDGVVLKVTDFAQQLLGEQRSGFPDVPKGYASKDGEICFLDDEQKRMEVFTDDGEVKARLDLQSIPGYIRTSLMGRANDGTPLFQATDMQGHFCFFTPESITYDGKLEMEMACLDDEGGVLLWQNSGLVRWNVETGEAKRLSDLHGLQANDCMGIRKNSKDQIVIAIDDGEELCFYRYVVGTQQVKGTLKIAAFFKNTYLEDCAADYERTHPGYLVEFVDFDNPFQNPMALNRLAEECKGQDGPDLIRFTQMDQVEKLLGAGCLAPMDDMLSARTKEGLFGCVMELGKVGDHVYAIPYTVSLSGFLVSKEVWTKENWTVRELMDCYAVQKTRNSGLERFMAINYATDAQFLLYELCLQNLEDTPFVDFEMGTCDFQAKDFYDLLKFCKENADRPGTDYMDSDEVTSQMRTGSAFVCELTGGLSEYSNYRARMGKDFASIGIPSQEGRGFIANSYDFMTVNAFSNNQALAADFLEYLLSEKCQVKYGMRNMGRLVRKDVIESHVRERVAVTDYATGKEVIECHFVLSSKGVTCLAVDENGDSFVKEFLAIMDMARPMSSRTEIREIISEEADAYFQGAKSAEDVADIIQRRVTLYLKEQ